MWPPFKPLPSAQAADGEPEAVFEQPEDFTPPAVADGLEGDALPDYEDDDQDGDEDDAMAADAAAADIEPVRKRRRIGFRAAVLTVVASLRFTKILACRCYS